MSAIAVNDRIYCRREASDYLRVSEKSIDRWMRAGRLKSYRIGRSVRFRKSDLDAAMQPAAGAAR
jgi:excisionase family DNA binding protein